MADQGYCPYGTKTKRIEKEAPSENTVKPGLRQSLLPAIPLLCSNSLQNITDIPVISVIEPNQGWPAADKPKVAVLATNATIKNGKYQGFLKKTAWKYSRPRKPIRGYHRKQRNEYRSDLNRNG